VNNKRVYRIWKSEVAYPIEGPRDKRKGSISGDTILNYFSSLFLHEPFGPVFLNKQDRAIFTVLEQAELLCKDWVD